MSAGCPVRKLDPEPRSSGPALGRVPDGGAERWVVRSFDVARQILREPEGTVQAGFGAGRAADDDRPGKMRPPILYLEGPQHRLQRSAAARLFAPKVTEDYRPMMEAFSRQLLARLSKDRAIDLSRLSMQMAVQVAAQVVGLTNSSVRGMSRRLDTFFAGDPLQRGRGLRGLLRTARTGTATARFYYLDVLPAIRARRRQPREDVVSQLLGQGFSNLDILTECITYGAAGMVTTRELITMAAWHLLDDPPLLERYRQVDRGGRLAILQETLRLEPVVGHLYRRTVQPLTVLVDGAPVELGVGSLVDLDLRAVNADAATVGAEPYGLRPERELPRSVPPALMSFGDGNHKCPGGPLAIMEAEVFLTELFARPVAADGPPRVRWNPVSQGFDLDGFFLRLVA